MPRRSSIVNSLTKGVIDPALSERIDLKHYYDALEDGQNLESTPQGGLRRRSGTSVRSTWDYRNFKRRQRRRLQPIDVTDAMVTVSNGGTKANLLDQNTATALVTNSVASATWVLCEVDLGEAVPVCFVDVQGFSCASGSYADVIGVEYYDSDASAWVAVQGSGDPEASPYKSLREASRTRRFGFWPGGHNGSVTSAQNWRVVVYDGVGAGAITVQGLRFWKEKRKPSPARGFSFSRSSDIVYELVLTDRNIDVFRDLHYVASIPVDIDAQQISEIFDLQSLDTLLLFHEDVQTVRITRQGANDEWDAVPATFSNVPALSAGTAFSGDQDEVQELYIDGLAAGQEVVFWLGAKVTAPVTYSDLASFPAAVDAALNAIGVGSGLVVSQMAGNQSPALRLTFAGNAGDRAWPMVTAVVLDDDDIDPRSVILQRGVDSTGDMMSETTGWARCGAFYQERLLVAGFRSAPMTIGFSRYGNEFNFADTSSPLTADLGMFITLNTDTLQTIVAVSIGRHIQIETDTSNWYVETRAIDATQPPNVVLATSYGAKRGIKPIFIDGATLFIQVGGRVVRDLTFSDVELSYKAAPISLLGPHLLTDVVSMDCRPARSTDEGNNLFFVNADGSVAFMSLLKDQEVVSLIPWYTRGMRDGKVLSVFTDILFNVWLLVERTTVANGTDVYLEKLDGSHTLDAAVTYDRGGVAASTIEVGDHQEGETVYAWADDDLIGPFVVNNATITLPAPASVVTVGLPPTVSGRLPKLREKLQNGYPWRPPCRIYEVGLSLAGTGQIDIATNGGPFRSVKLPFGKDERALDIGMDRRRDTTGISEGSASEQMERLIRSVCMIPGSGEFVYSTQVIERTRSETPGPVVTEVIDVNMHNTTDAPDFSVSLGQLQQALPKAENVSLFVTWFGDDLRVGDCELKPKVDFISPGGGVSHSFDPYDWEVAGVDRASADQVSLVSGEPQFGGTPADKSVVEAIQAIKAQGKAVTFTPFIIMDVPAGNVLPDPYGGASQAVYPWRGRITCDPAPGQPSTVDLTASAAAQVAAFVGTADVSDFAVAGEAVTYTGPAEWTYRRMILHYAHLCKAAGGVDTFVIGSEMRGLTWVRDALGSYPFVDELVALAADVKAVLGSGTKVTYAADWSEYFGHQTGVSGEIFFHLDPLWSSGNIDAIGIDNYWPLADWRDGDDHLDYVAGRTVYDVRYLQSNIEGGEGYDWYYASSADRDDQVRTSITDGAYGKPWVWRFKDIKNWWQNSHYNRPAGVESASATDWVPQSKPIWFMECGCPAVDKGANQPNVFYDPKSSESYFPYYSAGTSDPTMQRAYIEALLSYYQAGQTGFEDTNNPVSTVYAGRMVEVERMYVYTWDARFYPAYPQLVDVWSDGPLWEFGHWITGRVYLVDQNEGDGLPVGLDANLPMRQRLITGTIRVTNLRGFSRHPTIEFSQSIPAPLELRAIRYEISHN